MKKLLLNILLGRQAAEFALVVARVAKYPTALKTLAPAIASVTRAIAEVEAYEKAYGSEKARAMVEEHFPA